MADELPGSSPPPEAQTTPPPPPASETVRTGTLAEAEAGDLIRLRREAQEAQGRLKDRETRISELEDENHRLKAVSAPTKRRTIEERIAAYFPE